MSDFVHSKMNWKK